MSDLDGFDWAAYEAELGDTVPPAESTPVPAHPQPASVAAADAAPQVDGAALLDEVRETLCRYVVMPTPEAADAVVLWIAASHGQPVWEHATRLGVTGPAKRCGKSRLLEIIKATAFKALPAVHASTAALYRSIGSDDPPTVLIDEADTLFGTRRQAEANEDLRALINAGHSRGWPILRCVGPNQEVKEFQSFAMVALAGIGDLPDTITDRAVNIRMRRRAPHETVKPFRTGRDQPALYALRARIHRWIRQHAAQLRDAEPEMPVEDRAADTWESLIAVADLAGGDWPQRARLACTQLTNSASEADTDSTLAVRLLADLRTLFTKAAKLHTKTVLERLYAIEDAPWAARELTAHDLAKMLRTYEVQPKDVRETGTGPARKGYDRTDLADAFTRYLPSSPDTPDGTAEATPALTCDVADVADTGNQNATGLTSHVADVADVAAPPPETNSDGPPSNPDNPDQDQNAAH
jgi:hypothetical protein